VTSNQTDQGSERIAYFKDLCADAEDAHALGRFWADVLGLGVVDLGELAVRLDPSEPTDGRQMWIDQVPEPRSVKTRIHLDLRLPGSAPDRLVDAGARLVRQPLPDEPWWVLADPEGTLFCAFPAREQDAAPDAVGVFEVVVDSADPAAQAAWWSRVLGGRVESEDGCDWITGAAGFPFDALVFQPVAEPKTTKNRWHWDVDLADSDPSRLVGAGATVLREPGGDIGWWVLSDPEGNEFCAFAPKTG